MLRDALIAISNFIKGHFQALASAIALHYVLACLDNILLTGLIIWGTVALNQSEATEAYLLADKQAGLRTFITITTLNVIMGYIYICSHICWLPIMLCIVAMNPARFGMRRADELDDDELEMMGD